MNHPGHHTLELHVLGSLSGAESRAVEEHIAECAGCKDLVDLIADFYDAAEDNASASARPIRQNSAPATRPVRDLSRFREVYSASISTLAETRLQRFVSAIRRYPVAAGTISVGLVGAMALALALLVPRATRDTNPFAVSVNTSGGFVEVFNQKGEKLWDFPSVRLAESWRHVQSSKTSCVEVVDLDNDGRREIVTTLPFAGDERPDVAYLRALSDDKELLFRVLLGRDFSYENRRYDTAFSPTGFVLLKNELTKREEIFVGARNFRSPWYLGRFDNRGKEIGRYWHFGTLNGISLVDLEGDGHPVLVLLGINDVDDVAGGEFPVIAILDPSKIVGDQKSSAAPGFGFPATGSEIYYIRLPIADIDRAAHARGFVRALLYADREKIGFIYQGDGSEHSAFEYVFGPDLRLLEVKGMSGVDRIHAEMRAQKRLTSVYGPEYLDNLGRQVQYWDGVRWQNTPTRVTVRQ